MAVLPPKIALESLPLHSCPLTSVISHLHSPGSTSVGFLLPLCLFGRHILEARVIQSTNTSLPPPPKLQGFPVALKHLGLQGPARSGPSLLPTLDSRPCPITLRNPASLAFSGFLCAPPSPPTPTPRPGELLLPFLFQHTCYFPGVLSAASRPDQTLAPC